MSVILEIPTLAMNSNDEKFYPSLITAWKAQARKNNTIIIKDLDDSGPRLYHSSTWDIPYDIFKAYVADCEKNRAICVLNKKILPEIIARFGPQRPDDKPPPGPDPRASVHC